MATMRIRDADLFVDVVGWTSAARHSYFEHLQRMEDFISGEGLPTFRKLIRQEAVASLPAQDAVRRPKAK